MDEIQKGIVEWIKYDSKIKEENLKIKEIKDGMKGIKEKQGQVSEKLIPLLESNNMEEHTFNIPQYKKSFCCSNTSVTEGMTYKFLESCFTAYFDSGEKSAELIQFIKVNRKKDTKVVLKCSDLE